MKQEDIAFAKKSLSLKNFFIKKKNNLNKIDFDSVKNVKKRNIIVTKQIDIE